MAFETILSIATLGGFIWVVRSLLPKAVKEREPFAVTCAVLTALLALLVWLLIGVVTLTKPVCERQSAGGALCVSGGCSQPSRWL